MTDCSLTFGDESLFVLDVDQQTYSSRQTGPLECTLDFGVKIWNVVHLSFVRNDQTHLFFSRVENISNFNSL